MISTRKLLAASLVVVGAVLGVRSSNADTITVTDYHAPSAGVFTYDINFSATAVVQTGDGFMITDFGPVVSASFAVLDGTPPNSADFTMSAPNGGSTGPVGLNGETASAPNQDIFTNSLNISTAIQDSDAVSNAVFIWTGPTFTASTGSDLVLTLTSALTGSGTTATSIGVDHSGIGGNGLSLAESVILVPSSAPLPQSLLGGGLLLALLGAYSARKAIVRA